MSILVQLKFDIYLRSIFTHMYIYTLFFALYPQLFTSFDASLRADIGYLVSPEPRVP